MVGTIWHLNTSQRLQTLTSTNSNAYTRNRATDELILCDGVLWDHRVPRQIHKFDKLKILQLQVETKVEEQAVFFVYIKAFLLPEDEVTKVVFLFFIRNPYE